MHVVILIRRFSHVVRTIGHRNRFPALPICAPFSHGTSVLYPFHVGRYLIGIIVIGFRFLFNARTQVVVEAHASWRRHFLFRMGYRVQFRLRTTNRMTSNERMRLSTPFYVGYVGNQLRELHVRYLSIASNSLLGRIMIYNNCHTYAWGRTAWGRSGLFFRNVVGWGLVLSRFRGWVKEAVVREASPLRVQFVARCGLRLSSYDGI